MTNALLLSCVLFVGGLPSRAAAGPEALRINGDGSFLGLSSFQLRTLPPRLSIEQVKTKPDAHARKGPRLKSDSASSSQGLKVMHISGFVFLRGSANVFPRTMYEMITTWGSTTLQADGKDLNGVVSFSDTSSYFVGSTFISGFARPYAYVSVYENGKLLGTAMVSGSIFVSGDNFGGWVNLSGSGSVFGDLEYQEPDAPKKP